MSLVFIQWVAWVLAPGAFIMFICEIAEKFGHSVIQRRGISRWLR